METVRVGTFQMPGHEEGGVFRVRAERGEIRLVVSTQRELDKVQIVRKGRDLKLIYECGWLVDTPSNEYTLTRGQHTDNIGHFLIPSPYVINDHPWWSSTQLVILTT